MKPAERQLSDVTSVQAPVQDTSSATAMAGVAQGIAALGQTALTAFQIDKQQQQQELELQQEQALMEQKQSFEKELLKAKDIADQHGSTSLGFKTYLTMAFDQSQLDFDTKSKMLKDFQGTVLGKSFTELSPEEKAFQKARQEAGAAFYYTEFSTEEEIEQGVMDYIRTQRRAAADEAELRDINLRKARIGLTQAERTELETQLDRKQFNALANLAANGRTPQKNKIDSIIAKVQSGELNAKEGQELLRQAKGELEATIAQMTRDVKDKGSVTNLSQPLLDLYDIAIERTDSANILQELKDANELIKAKAEFNILASEPKMADLSARSKLFGHNAPLTQQITLETAKALNKNSQTDGKPVDLTEPTKDNKTYLDLLSSGIDSQGVLNPDGSEKIDPQELLVNVNNTILGANRYIDPEDTPTQNKQLLQWLAQPKVGEYIRDNMGQLTPAARVKLADTLINNAVNYVYPRVQELTSVLFVEEKRPRIGTSKVQKVSGVTEDEVEMILQGNSVVFRGTSVESQRVADTMNRESAGALTTYFNATANVSEDSLQSVFEREKAVVWPSKYGTPTEDGTYIDETTGEEFTIVDGKRQ